MNTIFDELEIANVLGFRMVDLLDEVERAQLKSVQFSPKLQEYLLKHRQAFHLFVKLVVERRTIQQIKDEFGLAEKEIFSLLHALDKLGLVQLQPGNQVKLPKLALVRDFGSGPLLSRIYKEWGHAIIDDLADPQYQASGQFFVRCLQMRSETYEELLARLAELEQEFLKRAVREMSISTSGLKPVRWMWMTDDRSFIRGGL